MDTPPPDEPQDNARGKIAAVAVIVLLLGGGLWLVRTLGNAAAVQDCVATGRQSCGHGDR